jgi:hypothetical protein
VEGREQREGKFSSHKISNNKTHSLLFIIRCSNLKRKSTRT